MTIADNFKQYPKYKYLTNEDKKGIEHYYSCDLKKNKCDNCLRIEPKLLELMGFKE